VPFISIDQVISIADLDEHHYMGKKSEGTGTIYTKKGGFIDIGHLRDQIDWTRYLYTAIVNAKGKKGVELSLPKEAGRKTLHLNIPEGISNDDSILLAGKITYDLSLWHEISTWFGASTVPLISEKFSSFSVEDMYSNLLGIHIGMKALHSNLPFDTAATEIISSNLDRLKAVKTAQETYDAYDAIHNKWYTSDKRIPSKKITLKRDPDVLHSSRPWVIPKDQNTAEDAMVLDVPLLDSKGKSLTNFYRLTIDLNRKFPIREIFPDAITNMIDQDDFELLLNRISEDLQIMGQHIVAEKKGNFQKN